MDLSNLRPADGSKHSDNFRRGRGPVSYTHLSQFMMEENMFRYM